MTFRKTLLVFAALALVVIGAGCGTLKIAGQPIGGASPTPTNTRVVRPTFTLIPTDTDTPVPTNTATSAPTQVPPTATATKKPVIVPTRPPATAAPILPTIPPAPTKTPFQYSFVPLSCNSTDPAVCNNQSGIKCSHSGGHLIDVFVVSNYLDPNSRVNGVMVRFSQSPGGPLIDPDETTGPPYDDGEAKKTLSTPVDPGTKNIGTYYAWVISGGNRISEYSPAIPINDKSDSDPTTCWVAQLAFGGGK